MGKTQNSPMIKIRRATPMDVVNIFRLVRRRAEQNSHPFLGIPEEHRGVTFLLDLIRKGYVIVADLSGRIVGTLGCSAYEPAHGAADQWVLDAEFFAVASGFELNGTGAALLQNLRAFAKKTNVPLRIVACKHDMQEFNESFLEKLGFVEIGTVYVLGSKEDGRREADTDDGEQETSVAGERGEGSGEPGSASS